MALAPLPTITSTPRYTSATLTAAVRVNIPFPIFGDGSDLLVSLDDVKQTSGWALKSDSGSLATLPRPVTDGYIEFTSPTTGLVQVWGRHVPRRTANLNESAGPTVRDFNLIALEDRALLSELFERLGRTIELPYGTTGGQLFSSTALANRLIGFDDDGNVALFTRGGAGEGEIENTQLANMAEATFKMRAAGAGTGAPIDGTASQARIALGIDEYFANMSEATFKMRAAGSGSGPAINGTAAQARAALGLDTLYEQRNARVVYPEDYGAVGDGTTDDSVAIQAALNALIAMGGGELVFRSFLYRCNARIVGVCADEQHITIRGRGRYQTIIDFRTGTSLGIRLQSTSLNDNRLPAFEIRDLGLITSADAAGIAIDIDYAEPNNLQVTGFVENILIGQTLYRTSDTGIGFGFWTNGIRLNNCRNGEIRNVHAFGELDKATKSQSFILLDGESTAVVMNSILALEWTKGIAGTGTCEGLYVADTDIVFCYYGFEHNVVSGAEPQMTIVNSSFNTSHYGVRLNNVKDSIISGVAFYACAALHSGTWPEWAGVILAGANNSKNKVVGCTFEKEAGRTGDTTIGIDFNGGRLCIASSNTFTGFSGNPMTWGMLARAGVTGIVADATNLFEHVTTRYSWDGAAQAVCSQMSIGGRGSFATGATVAFGQKFPSNPVVVACHEGTNTAGEITVSGVSTTGFTVNHNYGGSVQIAWVAVGPS